MKKMYSISLALLFLSIFISCEMPKNEPKDVTITLSSGVLGSADNIIETKEGNEENLPSGDTLWKTKEYTFLGWAKTENGDVSYKAGDKYSSTADMILYAIWTENPKITYLPNGGAGEAVTDYYKNGESVTIKNTSFIKKGYTLSYWSTSITGEERYSIGKEITLTNDLTLYAIWVEDKDDITISFNSGNLKKGTESIRTIEDNSIMLPSGDSLWITDVYTFSGWSTSEDGVVEYKAGEKYSSSASITLYAVWSTNPKITYDPNGGLGETIVESYKSGSKVTIKSTSFEMDGHKLYYWSTSAEGSDIYAIGQEIVLAEDLTLYAIWTEKKATLTYNSNGGAGNIGSVTVVLGKDVTLDDGSSFTREGFSISSWVDENGTNYNLGSKLTLSSDITLYAVWNENFNIKYYDGETLLGIEYPQGNTVIVGNCNGLSKIGHALYWTTSSDGKGTPYDVGEEYTDTESIVLYAQWQQDDGRLFYTLDTTSKTYAVKASADTISSDVIIPRIYKGKKVTSIVEWAFAHCLNITSITIPDSLTSIGDYAFSSCASLTSITIPNSVTAIGEGVFNGCTSLKSITLPNSITSIGHGFFNACRSLSSITIPNSVISIADWVFSGCESLSSITIPNSVTSIGDSAFSSCTNLSSIIIPDSVTIIGSEAFSYCSNLRTITYQSLKSNWYPSCKTGWSNYSAVKTIHCEDGDIVL